MGVDVKIYKHMQWFMENYIDSFTVDTIKEGIKIMQTSALGHVRSRSHQTQSQDS